MALNAAAKNISSRAGWGSAVTLTEKDVVEEVEISFDPPAEPVSDKNTRTTPSLTTNTHEIKRSLSEGPLLNFNMEEDESDPSIVYHDTMRASNPLALHRMKNSLNPRHVVQEAVELGKSALCLQCLPRKHRATHRLDACLILLSIPLVVLSIMYASSPKLRTSKTDENIPWWRVFTLLTVTVGSPVLARSLYRGVVWGLRKLDSALGESSDDIQTLQFYMKQCSRKFVRFFWAFASYCTYYIVVRSSFPANARAGGILYELHYWISRTWSILLYYLFGSLLVLITVTKITKHFSTRTFARKIATVVLDEYTLELLSHTNTHPVFSHKMLRTVDLVMNANIEKERKTHPRKIQTAQIHIMETDYLASIYGSLGINAANKDELYKRLRHHLWKVLTWTRQLRLRVNPKHSVLEAAQNELESRFRRVQSVKELVANSELANSDGEDSTRHRGASVSTTNQQQQDPKRNRNLDAKDTSQNYGNQGDDVAESLLEAKKKLIKPEKVETIKQEFDSVQQQQKSLLGPRGYLEKEDIEYYFDHVLIVKSGKPKVTAERAWDMLTEFQTDSNSSSLSKSEFYDAIFRIMEKRENLQHSLNDSKKVVKSLHTILKITMYTLLLLPSVWTLGIENLVEMVVGASSALLAASFVFGKAAREVFESIVYLFGVHVYDVGDLVFLDTTYRVSAISMLTTDMIRWDGAHVKMANSRLASCDIVNYSTSTNHVSKNDIIVDAGCLTEEVLNNVRSDMTAFANSMEAFNAIYITVRDPVEALKFKLAVVIEHSYAFDPARFFTDQSRMFMELLRTLEKYDISYSGVEVGQLNMSTARPSSQDNSQRVAYRSLAESDLECAESLAAIATSSESKKTV